MSTHTPGPWEARKQYANRWRIEHKVEGCIPLSLGIVTTTINEVGADRPGLSEANARLIAAAPELKRLLAEAVTHLDDSTAGGWMLEAKTLLKEVQS